MGQRADKPKTSDEDLLVLPLDFEMERAGETMRRFLFGLIGFAAFAVLVLAAAPVRETAMAEGRIRTAEDLIEVAHPEGGAVDAVLARPGAKVLPGDPLVRLRPVGVQAEVDRLELRRAQLGLRLERLDALLQGRKPKFEEGRLTAADALRRERALFQLERDALRQRMSSLTARLRQSRAESETRALEQESLVAEIAAYREQLNALRTLLDKGLARRPEYLALKARYAEARSRLALAEGGRRSAVEAVAQTKAEIAEVRATQRSEWSRERVEAASERADVERQLAAQVDRLARRTVSAPSAGVVQALHAATPGAVVQPGGPVATLVPVADELVAEVRISPNDIGHIRTGDVATVRISTFDPEVVGEIEGVVRRLSPTAFADEQGVRYFEAEIRLDRSAVELEGQDRSLGPGMAVTAQIRTGEKSVLRYLFKPVARALDAAFSER